MKDKKTSKLSVKIVLMLLATLMMFYLAGIIIIGIVRLFRVSIQMPQGEAAAKNWLFYFAGVVMLVMGVCILVSFVYMLNKTVVARIRKLNDATKEVIKGNLDVSIEVISNDELSSLTDNFNKMTAELRSNEYLSKEFVRNISHEFKTPLAAIRAYGELIETESDKASADKTALKEYAKIITEESDRLTHLSKSILQISLLDSTVIIKKEDVFCPAEQIRNILKLLHGKYAEKNIEFDLRLDELQFKSNEQLLYQVWQNLIGNAVKFSEMDSKIKIVLTHNNGALLFEITDSGAGIKDKDKDKIFTQFFMADESRNTEGNGLGLAIVKRIVDKLGGEVGFEKGESKGTKFFVRIYE